MGNTSIPAAVPRPRMGSTPPLGPVPPPPASAPGPSARWIVGKVREYRGGYAALPPPSRSDRPHDPDWHLWILWVIFGILLYSSCNYRRPEHATPSASTPTPAAEDEYGEDPRHADPAPEW